MEQNFIEPSCAEAIELLDNSALQKAILGRKITDILEILYEMGEPLSSQLTRDLNATAQQCFRDYQQILFLVDKIERQCVKDHKEIMRIVEQLEENYTKKKLAQAEQKAKDEVKKQAKAKAEQASKINEMILSERPIHFLTPEEFDGSTSKKPRK